MNSREGGALAFLALVRIRCLGPTRLFMTKMIKRFGTIEKAGNIGRPLKRALDKLIGVGSQGGAPKRRFTLGYRISRLQREEPPANAGGTDKQRTAHTSLIFQYRFSINRDFDDVADDDAASVQGVVPTDAEVLAVD